MILDWRKHVKSATMVFLASLLFYALTHSRNLSAAHDSISYINRTDSGIWFHEHHLLYGWVAANWVALWRALGYTGDSVFLVELLAALFGALTLTVFYLFLRTRLGMKPLAAVIGTTLPAFSFGFWFYSTTIDVYVIPLFFLTLALYLVTAKTMRAKSMLMVGFLHGVAILFHQVHVLFGAVVVAALFLKRRDPALSPWRAFFYYVMTLAPTVALPYMAVMVGVYKLYSIPAMWRWLTGHKARFWNDLGLGMFLKAAVAFGRSLIGGHFVFATSQLRGFLETLLQGRGVLEEQFLVRNMGDGLAFLLVGVSAIFVLLLAASTLLSLRHLRRLWHRQTVLMGAAVTWFAVYAAFFLFGGPMNVEFWIPQSLVWWLLFLMLWRESTSTEERTWFKSAAMLAVVSLLLLGVNALGSFQWLTDRNNDYYYARTESVDELVGPADLVVIDHTWKMGYYLERYADSRILILSSVYSEEEDLIYAVDDARRPIDETLSAGGTVLVVPEAVELERERRSLFEGGMSTFMAQLWTDYRDSWSEVEAGPFSFYRLDGDR